MPPRYSYWTILAGGLPTAFRAALRADLEPTFRRLREKHPDAEMKWFARGKLWASPEAARIDRPPRDRDTRGGTRGGGPTRRETPARPGEARGRDWRPGGEHRDPRQTFKDARKARNLDRRQEKFARKQSPDRWRSSPPREKPEGDRLAPHAARDRRFDRPAGPPRNDWRDRPTRDKPGDRLKPGARGFAEGGGQFANRQKPGSHAPRPYPDRPDRPSPEGAPERPARRPQNTRDVRAPSAPKGDGRGRPPRDTPAGPPRNDWRDRPPRATPPAGDARVRGPRPFERKTFPRSQRVEEPPPPRPPGPNREPRPGESPRPSPPPQPAEPEIPPPGPPERGRLVKSPRRR